MRRLLSAASRAGLALTLFLIVLAVLRWSPVHAEPPWDVHALPLVGWGLFFAVVAALTAIERRPGPWRPALVAACAVALVLGVVVLVRVPGGLACEVSSRQGPLGHLWPGPVDLMGRDLEAMPRVHQWTLHWAGELRAPEGGTYRLWADGRGRVQVDLDRRAAFSAEGERLTAGADVGMGPGAHQIEVWLHRTGPGPRLRLGWRRPSGRTEVIPVRYLGPAGSRLLWMLTDVLAIALAALIAGLTLLIPWDRPRPLPSPHAVTGPEIGRSLLAYAALVAIMSWPLVLHPAASGPVDYPDGRLNAWILAWDAHSLRHGLSRLFQAPAFHPLPDTLAFSENLLLPSMLAAPATLLGGPVLGYNLVLLASYVLSGLAVQLLIRRASGDAWAAFVGGAFFALGAHRWIKMAHLHAQVTVFLPLALLAFDRFWERRTLGRALLVGLLLALQGLSSVYLGAITATVLMIAVAVGLLGGLRGGDVIRLGAGFLLAAVLLAPVARPYFRMREFQGQEFTLADVANYATTLESYAASSSPLYAAIGQRHLDPDRVREPLFPGLVPVALGLAGLARAPRRYWAVALAAVAIAVTISLGPETAFYRVLHENVVLFRGVRALSRYSLVPVLSLAVLSGLALAGRPRLALLALALFLCESNQAPFPYGAYDGPSPTARWLAGREGAVAYLPLGERDTQVMLDGVAHFRPLLNGDSGFMPRPYTRAMELLDGPLRMEGLRFLRAVGVRHVVARADLDLPLAQRFGDEQIYEVPAGEAAQPIKPGQSAPTWWTGDGLVIDLGSPRTAGRVVFELDEAPWQEHPRVGASTDGERWTDVEATASLADATVSLYRDPRHGRGEIRFAPIIMRYLRLPSTLPIRPGAVEVDR